MTPRQEINDALLFIEPARVVMAIGEQVRMRAYELDLEGNAVPVVVEWAPPLGVAMDAQDNFFGLEVGVGVARAFATSNRKATIEVEVVGSPAPAPVSLRSTPAALSVGVGETVPFAYDVLDGLGAVIAGSPVEWVTDGSSIEVLDGAVRGVAPGVTLLLARAPGQAELLAGGLIVSVGNPTPKTCEAHEEVTGCFLVEPPYYFTGSDVADKVVVGVGYAQYGTDCNRLPWLDLRLEHPTSITVQHPKVVNVSGGKLAALAPGNTRYRALVGDSLCGELDVGVTLDYGGDWSFDCSGGTKGTMSVSGWVAAPYHLIGMIASGAIVPKTDFPLGFELSFDSCTSGASACSATQDQGWSGFFGGCSSPVHTDACTSQNPCCGIPSAVCDTVATGEARVTGVNTFQTDKCTFERGTGSCGGSPPPGEGCFFNTECGSGLICNSGYPGTTRYGNTTDGTCRALSKQGEKCRIEQECVSGLYCQFDPPIAYCTSTTGKRGVCAPKGSTGAACECPAACDSEGCSAGVCK